MPSTTLRSSRMMAHLIDSLEAGRDIGHYGRLVFAIVARYFLPEREIRRLLLRNPGLSKAEAAGLLEQVESHGYSPPTRSRVLEWQTHQDFPICPDPEDPDSCNVYRDLVFPDAVYDRIEEYHVQKVRPRRARAAAARESTGASRRHEQGTRSTVAAGGRR